MLNVERRWRQSRRLEQGRDLGRPLLLRSTRQLKLTPAGEAFLPRAQALLADWDHTRASLNEVGGAVRGPVSITAVNAFGREHILPAIPSFLARYPETQVALSLDNRVVDLHQEPFDLAVRIGAANDSTLKGRLLANNRTVLVAAPAYLARHGAPTQPEDLKQHNCLTLSRPRQQVWWHFARQQQRRKLVVQGNFAAVGSDPPAHPANLVPDPDHRHPL